MENKFENKMKEMDEFADELKVFIETVMVKNRSDQVRSGTDRHSLCNLQKEWQSRENEWRI